MRVLVVLWLVIAAATQVACTRSVQHRDYASTDEAVQALLAAVKSGETRGLLEVLGNDAKPVVESGDPVQDRQARERFMEAYQTAHSLETPVEGLAILQIGSDNWPFPFPLLQHEGRWHFDTADGSDEIINRRVGKNEFSTVQSCLAFVDAEREYYVRNPQNDPLLHYAQKFVSSEGQKDGLYWPTAGDEPPSPLGAGFARARAEGYALQGDKAGTEPYHGYLYRLLTGQGPNAAGGAHDYMVRDKMLGGFALMATPAEYGTSGVMTFIVNYDGVVFSKDLGPDTAKVAAHIELFDPDESWKREAAI
ncbi:MAG TPA: DUF2950 domain-containing protein [Steroidobacteraceae bacterium]|nr:DUF2950 domain-containing protein [Steroidobacteraceae bacterium]